MSALAYRSKQSNGYDDQVMALFDEGLNITPDRLSYRRFWVAEVSGLIVGCIALDVLDKTTGEVRTFFTDPAHKGRGVGFQMWRTLLTIAQSQGLTRLVAHSDRNSTRYYESLGFTVTGKVPCRSVPSEMLPYMVRDI